MPCMLTCQMESIAGCYVITGKTYFEDREINYSKEHYIDVWIHIDEMRDVDFSECPGNSL